MASRPPRPPAPAAPAPDRAEDRRFDADSGPGAQTPGEILRSARMRRHLSLAEAEQGTKIRLQYLKALEDDDYSSLPAGVYWRGFLRNYAIYLGVPPDEVAGEVSSHRSRDKVMNLRTVARPVRVVRPRATWLLALVASIVAVVVVALVWLGLTAPNDTPKASPSSPAASTTPLVVLPPLATAATATAPAAPTSAPTAAPTANPGNKVDVELKVTDRSWVRATVDGRVVLEEILATGQVQRWSGQQSVALRVGNAGGVDVTVNGQHIGALGPPGQVMDREFTR